MKIRTMNKALLVTLLTVLTAAVTTAQAQCSKGDETSTRTYSLYKEYFKQGNIERALPYWREIFHKAPGLYKGAFIDGVDIVTTLIQDAQDPALKEKYVDTLMMVYDKRIECWGDKGYVLTRKAIDLAKYRPQEYPKVKSILEEAIATDKQDAKYYALTTYFKILLNLKDEPGGVSGDYIREKYPMLIAYCDANINAGVEEAENFAEARAELEYLFKEYVLPKRFAPTSEWNTTLTTNQKLDSLAKWMNEDPSRDNLDQLYAAVRKEAALRDSTVRYLIEDKLLTLDPSADKANNVGAWHYGNKEFEAAIPYFIKAVALAEAGKEKARFAMSLADTYRMLDQFPESRDAALMALGEDSTSGKPYYMIGVLYMSSGKLCGPGTGFDSQRVLWPAFDYLEKAKAVDPSFTETIDDLLKEYKKYLPDRAAIAQKGLKVGGNYFVPCWIQEESIVRSKD
jgi:tetratricopeptide (TPR) repeat protein